MTAVSSPRLCPELRFPGLPEGQDFDAFRVENEAALGASVPYWAVAWPGGQGLARYLLDHPSIVRDRSVIDLACGSGLVAAAAMRAGAAQALAVDRDPNALVAAIETARLNEVAISVGRADIAQFNAADDSVICAGDLWYEPIFGRQATKALRRLADLGHTVICGDPGRPGRPRQGVVERARYEVETSEAFEAQGRSLCRVFELRPAA